MLFVSVRWLFQFRISDYLYSTVSGSKPAQGINVGNLILDNGENKCILGEHYKAHFHSDHRCEPELPVTHQITFLPDSHSEVAAF